MQDFLLPRKVSLFRTNTREMVQMEKQKKMPSNQKIAEVLDQIAYLLETQEANPFRVRAYRNAANRARDLKQSLARLVVLGDGQALQELPDIGEGLARVISRYVQTGQSEMLYRLQGEVTPEELFEKVPGIGPYLSERIVNELDINTLEELEQAAFDGRLAHVKGFGPNRVNGVRVSLTGMLSRPAQKRAWQRLQYVAQDEPSVEVLLDVDAEYRAKAEADKLPRITPRRFNPAGKAWLPILHTSRKGWNFTTLYSNTLQAHKLKMTHDWVVIYYEQAERENQVTVVTATHGLYTGKRIVRGRETECERYFRKMENKNV